MEDARKTALVPRKKLVFLLLRGTTRLADAVAFAVTAVVKKRKTKKKKKQKKTRAGSMAKMSVQFAFIRAARARRRSR